MCMSCGTNSPSGKPEIPSKRHTCQLFINVTRRNSWSVCTLWLQWIEFSSGFYTIRIKKLTGVSYSIQHTDTWRPEEHIRYLSSLVVIV